VIVICSGQVVAERVAGAGLSMELMLLGTFLPNNQQGPFGPLKEG